MDGASKFVHGDAVAGLLITGINLVGGLVLGLSQGLDLAKAAETFSVLSVGDALASQVPALLVSAASGLVVTRSATGDQVGTAIKGQILGRRRPVTLTAGVLTLLALVPGMPAIPLLALAGALAMLAKKAPQSPKAAADEAEAKLPERKPGSAEEIESTLTLDILTLELGYEMVHLVDAARGGTLLERVGTLRQELARDLGVVVPPVHVCDNLELDPGKYRVLLLGNEVGSSNCRAGRLLAIDPDGVAPPIEGEKAIDPTFGLPARWIHPRDKEMAEALGYTVVDHATVLATHLGELLRVHAHQLLGRQEAQHLLDVLARTCPKLVDDVVPNLLSLGDVLRVLRNLLRERISVRDLRTILEGLADLSSQTKDPEQLTELVRERMSAQITSRLKAPDGAIHAMCLDPRVEDVLRRSLRDIATGQGGAIDPELLTRLGEAVARGQKKLATVGAPPLVVCPPDLRRYVRAIVERKHTGVAVVSFREIEASASLRVVETLSAGGPPAIGGNA
jgi:flagellar biosynthesis protein FlhA